MPPETGHFLNRQLPFFRLSLSLWVLVLVSGVSSTCWKVMAMTTLAPMFMCGKVTHKNLIDGSPYSEK